MFLNPLLYEVNTRVWIKKFEPAGSLSDIPETFINELARCGINYLWLMGVWKNSPEIIKKYCFDTELIQAYSKALKDWREEDVIGSPYSISSYELNESIGKVKQLKDFKIKLNEKGIKLILDFVPNHFSADTELIKTNPDLFLQADEEILARDNHTYFKSGYWPDKVFAHGRDPLFPAWKDTVQINHFNPEAREFLTQTILKLSHVCDGIRCDMAMLPLNNVFHNTWLGIINKYKIEKPKNEFWIEAISKVKKIAPDFIFIAEAYWDLEWDLQKLGFDFTYDKRLTDQLANNDIPGIRSHLHADINFQQKSIRFLENHDETRAIVKFGKEKAEAAAVIMTTIPGMKLFYDGQFDGKRVKVPVQLRREPLENGNKSVKIFYDNLLQIIKADIFKLGKWEMLNPLQVHPEDATFENIFAWQWMLGNQRRIIVINYSAENAHCRLKLELPYESKNLILIDELNKKEYDRSVKEIIDPGLYIELNGFKSHIFKFEI